MTNVVYQSAWWNPLLTSAIFIWLGGTATYITIISFKVSYFFKSSSTSLLIDLKV